MKKFKRVKLNLRTYGCTINYVRNPKWFVFTHESQRNGCDYIDTFPWRKKNIFEIAYTILATRYFNGDIEWCKNAVTILSLTKHTYPTITINNQGTLTR